MSKKQLKGKSSGSVVEETHDMLDSAVISVKQPKIVKFKILFSSVLFGIIALVQGCESRPGNEGSVVDRQFENLLSKTWKVAAVTLDGTSQEGYDEFTLVFSGDAATPSFQYATANPPQTSPWPANGVCTFDLSNPATKMIRDPSEDKVLLTYSLSGGKLRVSFIFSGVGYEAAATSNVRGNWIFDFL